MNALTDLISLAQAALDPSLPADDAIERIEVYTQAFSSLQDSEGALPESLPEEELKTLQELHTALLRKAQVLKQTTSDDLTGLYRKGKGLLAYIDILPKSISTRRERKG